MIELNDWFVPELFKNITSLKSTPYRSLEAQRNDINHIIFKSAEREHERNKAACRNKDELSLTLLLPF